MSKEKEIKDQDKSEDLVANVMAGSKNEASKSEDLPVKKDETPKEEKTSEEKAALKPEAKKEGKKETEKPKTKKENQYLIVAGAISLSGSRIAKSGEIYPEGAFQKRTVSDLIKNGYIKKHEKKQK